MPRGRKLQPLDLSAEEQEVLQNWARRRKTAQGLATRARIVLLAAEAWTSSAIAEHLHVTRVTVAKWRARFLERRLDGLTDERPQVHRELSGSDASSGYQNESADQDLECESNQRSFSQLTSSPTAMEGLFREPSRPDRS